MLLYLFTQGVTLSPQSALFTTDPMLIIILAKFTLRTPDMQQWTELGRSSAVQPFL